MPWSGKVQAQFKGHRSPFRVREGSNNSNSWLYEFQSPDITSLPRENFQHGLSASLLIKELMYSSSRHSAVSLFDVCMVLKHNLLNTNGERQCFEMGTQKQNGTSYVQRQRACELKNKQTRDSFAFVVSLWVPVRETERWGRWTFKSYSRGVFWIYPSTIVCSPKSFFQALISDLASAITSSSELCFRRAFTDIPMRVDCKPISKKGQAHHKACWKSWHVKNLSNELGGQC